jgi:hypothetical protein
MKVEKIEIKKELVEIPDGKSWIDFAFWNPIDVRYISDGTVPSGTAVGGNRRYEVQKVERIADSTPTHYLVSVDDRRIFQDLIAISDSSLSAAVDEKTNWYRDWTKRQLE